MDLRGSLSGETSAEVWVPPSFSERWTEYQELFCGDDQYNVKSKALLGGLRNSSLRSIAWKTFLGVLPNSNEIKHKDWPQVMAIHRKAYESLTNQYETDPREAGREMDATMNNPLSLDSDSPWMAFWQNEELQKEIEQDILRTYPEKEFFQRSSVRQMMLRILFVYARQNPQLSYKQGMHELLAPILYLTQRESLELKSLRKSSEISAESEEMAALLDQKYVEHDAFASFDHLMNLVKPWFHSDHPGGKRRDHSSPLSDSDENSSPVVEKCRFVQNVILREKDPELYQKLNSLKIEPQLYMLRWIRLLMGREFHLEDVLILWDAMFSYSDKSVGADLQLIDYICVAMLIYIRGQIINMDYSSAMRRLFKYPPVEDVLLFVEQALNLQQNAGVSPFVTPMGSASFNQNRPSRKKEYIQTERRESNVISNRPRGNSAKENKDQILNRIISVVTPKENSNAFSNSKSNSNSKENGSNSHHAPAIPAPTSRRSSQITVAPLSTEEQLTKMKSTQAHMANRLERIIYSIQKEMLEKESTKTEEEKMDALMVAVAEMKQVKDVLSGLLPPECFFFDDIPSHPALPKSSSSAPATPVITVDSDTEIPEISDQVLQRRRSDPFGISEFQDEQ